MTTMHVCKNEEGRLDGATEKDRKAYAIFKKQLAELGPGELFVLSFWFARNPKLHGKYFAMLTEVWSNQEQFEELEPFRKWCTVGAGDCDFYPGPTGKSIAIPHSIAFHEMDDVTFSDHFDRVKRFLRTLHATRFLWPAIEDSEAGNMMAALIDPFEG